MKNTLIVLLTLILFSCTQKQEKYQFSVYTEVRYDGMSTFSTIKCDSVDMKSETTAIVFINGYKMTVIANRIQIESNNNFTPKNK